MEPQGLKTGERFISYSSLSSPQSTNCNILSALPPPHFLVCPSFLFTGVASFRLSSPLAGLQPQKPSWLVSLPLGFSSTPPPGRLHLLPRDWGWHEKSHGLVILHQQDKEVLQVGPKVFLSTTKLAVVCAPSPPVTVMGFLLLFPAVVYPPVCNLLEGGLMDPRYCS